MLVMQLQKHSGEGVYFNDISEDTILRADMLKAREEIGIALLAISGILYH